LDYWGIILLPYYNLEGLRKWYSIGLVLIKVGIGLGFPLVPSWYLYSWLSSGKVELKLKGGLDWLRQEFTKEG